MSEPTYDASGDRAFFGHPRGLAILFFTELWERFGYYGMRALLILYLTATVEEGGLAFNAAKAGAIYALYTSMVYLLGVPGGWVADRFFGQRKSVLWGGIFIAAGYLSMAVPRVSVFYLGLVLVIVGTGLLKPNISTIVGQLYTREDERRDSAFSIFYMGINIGALGGPALCSYLGETISWQLGFGCAGVGMVIGLIVYTLGGRVLGDTGLHPVKPEDPAAAARQNRMIRVALVLAGLVAAVLVFLQFRGIIHLTIEWLADSFGVILAILTLALFAYLFTAVKWTPKERRRILAILFLFLAASIFWGAYEQAGSSFNLFADDLTDRVVAGFEFPAGWFQTVPAAYCVALAPLFAFLWIWMGKRQPSSPVKFSLGLIFVGLGFVVMIAASLAAGSGERVGPGWLMTTYFLHVIGEMCLSPVGLSTVTKLAPARVTSLMMGVWFLAAAVGNYVGGRAAGLYESLPLPQLFGAFAAVTIVAGLVLLLFSRLIRKLMGGVL